MYVCIHCNKTITVSDHKARHRVFCSTVCRNAHNRGNTHTCWQKDAKYTPCLSCGENIRITKRTSRSHRFCSRSCWRDHQRKNPAGGRTICPQCSKEFTRGHKDQICCSTACRSLFFEGPRSRNWTGGRVSLGYGRKGLYSTQKRNSGISKGEHFYFLEHRVAIAECLGRPLSDDEKVWHIDCDLSNNALDNLFVFPNQKALLQALTRGYIPLVSNLDKLKSQENYIYSVDLLSSKCPPNHPALKNRLFLRGVVALTHNAKCRHCGRSFHCPSSLLLRKHFCSQDCRRAYPIIATRLCACCGKEINVRRSQPNRKFCNVICSRKTQNSLVDQRELACIKCHKLFVAKQDHGEWPKYCSLDCYRTR